MMTGRKFPLISYLEPTIQQGGVFIYYRNVLPLKILGTECLQECINFEIIIVDKLCRFVSLHCSPSQLQDDFEPFANDF